MLKLFIFKLLMFKFRGYIVNCQVKKLGQTRLVNTNHN